MTPEVLAAINAFEDAQGAGREHGECWAAALAPLVAERDELRLELARTKEKFAVFCRAYDADETCCRAEIDRIMELFPRANAGEITVEIQDLQAKLAEATRQRDELAAALDMLMDPRAEETCGYYREPQWRQHDDVCGTPILLRAHPTIAQQVCILEAKRGASATLAGRDVRKKREGAAAELDWWAENAPKFRRYTSGFAGLSGRDLEVAASTAQAVLIALAAKLRSRAVDLRRESPSGEAVRS